MLTDALRYPLADRRGRDALAVCIGCVLATLVLVRVAGALWPTWPTLLPVVLSLGPTALFAGYLGGVLRAWNEAAPAFELSTATLLTGVRVLAVAGAYLLPPAVVLVGVVFALLELETTPTGSPLLAIAPTVALFSVLVFGYLLPGGLGRGVRGGIRAGVSRRAVRGLGSAGYFFGWTAAFSLLATAWGALGATRASTPLSVLAVVWFTYAHVVAARLVADGLARSGWRP